MGLENYPDHVGSPILAVKLFSWSVGATISQKPWLLKAC